MAAPIIPTHYIGLHKTVCENKLRTNKNSSTLNQDCIPAPTIRKIANPKDFSYDLSLIWRNELSKKMKYRWNNELDKGKSGEDTEKQMWIDNILNYKDGDSSDMEKIIQKIGTEDDPSTAYFKGRLDALDNKNHNKLSEMDKEIFDKYPKYVKREIVVGSKSFNKWQPLDRKEKESYTGVTNPTLSSAIPPLPPIILPATGCLTSNITYDRNWYSGMENPTVDEAKLKVEYLTAIKDDGLANKIIDEDLFDINTEFKNIMTQKGIADPPNCDLLLSQLEFYKHVVAKGTVVQFGDDDDERKIKDIQQYEEWMTKNDLKVVEFTETNILNNFVLDLLNTIPDDKYEYFPNVTTKYMPSNMVTKLYLESVLRKSLATIENQIENCDKFTLNQESLLSLEKILLDA